MIFVTGSSGFVGRAVLYILNQNNINYQTVSRDVLYGGLSEFLDGYSNITLIHCAWSMNYIDPGNEEKNQQLNDAILRALDRVDKMVFISSIQALTSSNKYSKEKNRWEGIFNNAAMKPNSHLSVLYLPHIVAPEVGMNHHSVIYKFYKNWKKGRALNVYEDIDISYTDMYSLQRVLLQAISGSNSLRLTPEYNVMKVSQIKSVFLENDQICPILESLKNSRIVF